MEIGLGTGLIWRGEGDYRRGMSMSPLALRPIAATLLAALLVASPSTAQTAQAGAPANGGAASGAGIIPLPLMPIVPAAQRSCAMRTPSGLGYTMLRAGTGGKPAADATVLVNYIGYLNASGAVFDQAMRTPMPVGGLIPGFSEGLQLMARGSVVRLCVPPALGYGAQASGPIPANADLVFQIELLDFKTAAEIEELRKAAGAAPPVQRANQP